MKIANSRYYGVLAASVAGALLMAAFPPARAQTTVTDLATESSAATMTAAAASVPMPPSPIIEKSGGAASFANSSGVLGEGHPSAAGKDAKFDAEEDAENADKKIPGQVTEIVKKLQGAKVDLSLEDMNQARGALARLDLLLELEQKMGDLDKARAKRTAAENMADEVSALLPRGVTRMPTRMSSAAPDMAQPVVTPVVVKPQPPPGNYTVQRINGVGGNYTAQLRDMNDEKTTVRVGDKLPDGTAVTAITPGTVSLRGPNDKTDRVLRINSGSPINHGRRAP